MLPLSRLLYCLALPLPPPAVYWELHKLVSKYIWKRKCLQIKISFFPNLKSCFWFFSLRALHTWLNPDTQAAWCSLEEKLKSPHRLWDIIYSNIPLKTCRSSNDPVISHFNAPCQYTPEISLCFPLCFVWMGVSLLFLAGGIRGLTRSLILFRIMSFSQSGTWGLIRTWVWTVTVHVDKCFYAILFYLLFSLNCVFWFWFVLSFAKR